MTNTILATFDNMKDAQSAVDALTSAGFNRSDIGLAAQNPQDRTSGSLSHASDDLSRTGSTSMGDSDSVNTSAGYAGAAGGTVTTGIGQMGAAPMYAGTGDISGSAATLGVMGSGLTDDTRYGDNTRASDADDTHVHGSDGTVRNPDDMSGSDGAGLGAVFGTLVGAVAGLVAIAIPGIGPIIAAGPLAAVLGAAAGAGIGAASGAVTGGVTASLVKFGVPEEDANYYAESLRRGGALVSVTVEPTEADRATHILQQYHPVDIDQRVTQWRAKGWSGFDSSKEEGYKATDRMEAEGMGAVETDSNPMNQTDSTANRTGQVRRYPSNS